MVFSLSWTLFYKIKDYSVAIYKIRTFVVSYKSRILNFKS